MKQKRLSIISGLLLCVLSGCSSYPTLNHYSSIYEDYNEHVDLSDGVSDLEAVVIAKKYIFQKGMHQRLHSLVPIDLIEVNEYIQNDQRIYYEREPQKKVSFLTEQSWVVLFREKSGSLFSGHYPVIPFYIKIDRESGKVHEWGYWDDQTKQKYLG